MDTPISKYPSVDALMRPKMLARGAKGGVQDGLNNDQPRCARGPVQAARPREALANVGTFASHLHKAGPCLCSAREDSQSDNVQDPASSNPPVSAALVLPPSYVVSACSSWLQTEAANRFRALLPRVLPNTGPYLRSPRPYVSTIAAHEKLVWCSKPNLPRFQRHCRSDL